jgi:RNase H-like domain found in reverse transcriptase
LTSAERNYSTSEKECLAIVWAILQLRPYLEGQKFIIRTNHYSIRWVLNLADAQGRLACWRLRLLESDFEVQYALGRGNHGADTMSRLRAEDAQPVDGLVDTEIPCFMVSPDEEPSLIHVKDVRELQSEDLKCQKLLASLTTDLEIDISPLGLVGHVYPSGEFEVQLPPVICPATPVTIVSDPPPLDEVPPGVFEDAHLLRREEGTRDKFSFSLSTPVPGPIRLGPIRLIQGEKPPGLNECLPDESETIHDVKAADNAEKVLPQATQTEELIREQARDKECKAFAAFAGLDSIFDFNADGLLVRIAPLDKAKTIVVSASLRPVAK